MSHEVMGRRKWGGYLRRGSRVEESWGIGGGRSGVSTGGVRAPYCRRRDRKTFFFFFLAG